MSSDVSQTAGASDEATQPRGCVPKSSILIVE